MTDWREVLEARAFHGLMALPSPLVRRLAGRPVVRDGQVLDPETQWMLRLEKLAKEPPVASLPIPEGRRALDRQARLAGGTWPVGATRDLDVPTPAGPMAARLYVPTSRSRLVEPVETTTPGPLLVFLHGGGMIYGGLDSHDAVCRFLAERMDVRVLALDYRLAPEHPFPAGLDDAWAGYQWAVEHAEELGADPARIGVGGDSAGGYLSAAVALKAAGAGVPCALQLLVYPVTDHVVESESRRTLSEGFYLDRQFIELANASYLPPHVDRRDPDVSVGQVEKVPDDLAPAIVATAGFDPLRDEGEAYARLLAEAGVAVQLRRYPGAIHGFLNTLGITRSSRAAVGEIAALARELLHR